MSFPAVVCAIFFAGGVLSIASFPLLPKARGFLLLSVGVALASCAMAHWTIAPAYPEFGLATRAAAPYGLGLAGGFLTAALVVWGLRPGHSPASPTARHAHRMTDSRSVGLSPNPRA